MTRKAMRIARQLRDEWLAGLTGGPVHQATNNPARGRGADYRDAPQLWVCNRKKSYPSEEIAHQVAVRLNEANEHEDTARDGFFGVVVQPYGCGRCGGWHLGR